jgi:hypothetical protein
MFRTHWLSLCSCLFLLAAIVAPVSAENEGQADLDKATQLKVAAENLDDLGEVIDHLDTALEKGLDKENTKFAQQLLVASLLQRGRYSTYLPRIRSAEFARCNSGSSR